MYFKKELFYIFITFIFDLSSDFVLGDVVSNHIPQEVINRKGGMSNKKKEIMFTNGIKDIYVGPTMRSIITSESLKNYAVCEGSRTDSFSGQPQVYKYFFCPEYSSDQSNAFCCVKNGESKCCTEFDFRSNVKFVRSDLYASVSTILGITISLFNLLIVTIVLLYWCMLKRRKNKPPSTFQIPTASIPMSHVSYPSRSDLTENTASKSSLHMRNKNNPSILSKPMSNTPTNSIIIAPRPMKKR